MPGLRRSLPQLSATQEAVESSKLRVIPVNNEPEERSSKGICIAANPRQLDFASKKCEHFNLQITITQT